MKITHNGTEITYDEERNLWCFTLRNRDRSVESLAKAKEVIDKAPSEKKKPFARIKAWFLGFGDDPTAVEITGIAESPRWRRNELCVWINHNGTRRKEYASDKLFPQTEINDAICADIMAKRNQIKELEKECSKLRGNLTQLKIEQEEAE